MKDQEMEILMLKGEILLLQKQIDWWAANQDFWRCKYISEHPELQNWEYMFSAFSEETGTPDPL